MSRRRAFAAVAVFVILSVTLPPVLADWAILPDPQTGDPRAVWAAGEPEGGDALLSFSRLVGPAWSSPIAITVSGYAPGTLVAAGAASGEIHAAWGATGSVLQVRMNTFDPVSGSWSEPITVSAIEKPSERPSIVVHDGDPYVGYETVGSNGARSAVVAKADSGGDVERSIVSGTSSTAALEVEVHSAEGHLWVDWIGSTTAIGYSEHVSGDWQSVQVESCTSDSDCADARGRVRKIVLGH